MPSSRFVPGGADCLSTPTDDACSEARERYRLQRNDLLQQVRSADAAEAGALLSYQQGWVALIGLVLGVVTMSAAIAAAKFARDAAVEARRGANAAEQAVFDGATAIAAAVEANEEMREANVIARSAQRPWVVVESVAWLEHGIAVYFKNIGPTPAPNLLKGAEAIAMPPVFLVYPLPPLDPHNGTTLFPGATEIMTVEAPDHLKEGYEWFVRVRAAYDLPNGTQENYYEGFAFNTDRKARKVTSRDFLPLDKRT